MDKTSIKDVKIRDMESADADCVAGFIAELNLFEASLSADRDPSEQAGKDHFDYVCGEIKSLDGFCLVAELEEKILGCLLAAPDSMPGFIVKPEYREYGEIYDIYVVPEARESGLARKLISEAADRFRKMGFRQVGLFSQRAIELPSRPMSAYGLSTTKSSCVRTSPKTTNSGGPRSSGLSALR